MHLPNGPNRIYFFYYREQSTGELIVKHFMYYLQAVRKLIIYQLSNFNLFTQKDGSV